MKISEIADLISIRDYVSGSINNFSLKKEHVKELNKTLILLDKMIVEELIGQSFKEKINFKNAETAVKEVVDLKLRVEK